jgi:hypothetical protein
MSTNVSINFNQDLTVLRISLNQSTATAEKVSTHCKAAIARVVCLGCTKPILAKNMKRHLGTCKGEEKT